LEDFVEQPNCQWDPGGTADIGFNLGDKVTWQSNRTGYGPINDTVCGIDWTFDEDGYEHLVVLLGDPVPDIMDKMRGGGRARWTGDDGGSRLPWGLKGDAGTYVGPDTDNTVTITSTDASLSVTETPASNLLDLSVIATGHAHDHDELTDVTADQHHAGYIGNLGNLGAGASPDANDKISFLGDGDTYAFNAHDNQVDFTGPWTRFDAGSSDPALRQTNYADDIRLKADANTDVIWLEGDTGKSHFKDDMYIGSASADVASFRLHINDSRATAGLVCENAQDQKVSFSVDDTSGILVVNNISGNSHSFQIGSDEMIHIHGDKTRVSIKRGAYLAGYSDNTGVDLKWQINSATGSLYLYTTATTTFGDYVYTWPTSGADQYDVLQVASISSNNVTLGWVAPGVTSIGNGTEQYQVPMTGADPFTPAWHTTTVTSAANSIVRTDSNGYIRATRLEAGGVNAYLSYDGNRIVVNGGTVDLASGGTVVIRMESGTFFPMPGVTMKIGTTTYRFSEGNFIAGNFSGDVTIGTAAKGIVMSDNSSSKVLGGDGTRYTPKSLALTGKTDNWAVYGSQLYDAVVDASGNALYFDATGHVSTNSAGTAIRSKYKNHTHNLAGGEANAGITIS